MKRLLLFGIAAGSLGWACASTSASSEPSPAAAPAAPAAPAVPAVPAARGLPEIRYYAIADT